MDWKVRKNLKKNINNKGTKVVHFREAFHGRSGYTMSITNTDPVKVEYFPKFDWPRIDNPKIIFPIENNIDEVIESEKNSINQIKEAFANNRNEI